MMFTFFFFAGVSVFSSTFTWLFAAILVVWKLVSVRRSQDNKNSNDEYLRLWERVAFVW